MKKKIFLISTLGIAAGLLYALESNRRKRATAEDQQSGEQDSSGTGRSSTRAGERSAENERTASMAKIDNGKARGGDAQARVEIDDQSTDQNEASHILKEIRDSAFEGSDEKLALALGRPSEEIEQWNNGTELIDGDVLMKARALAMQRGLEIE
jgi:hypothetical protein